MDDLDKTRVAYVATMENQLNHMRSEYEKYKSLAEKWEPVITSNTDTASGKITFGLRFGGKNVHATVTNEFLVQMDTTGATSAIVDSLVESLVIDQLAKVLRPEVERAQKGAKSISNVGKW
jgi:uncharacterized protein (DUF111 family)